MRLIDADALMDELENDRPLNWTNSPGEIQEQNDWDRFMGMVSVANTIDAVHAKHSFWECYETSAFGGYKDGDPHWLTRKFFRCKRCRKGSAIKSNFCPNCGADMGERKDGEAHADYHGGG